MYKYIWYTEEKVFNKFIGVDNIHKLDIEGIFYEGKHGLSTVVDYDEKEPIPNRGDGIKIGNKLYDVKGCIYLHLEGIIIVNCSEQW